MSMLVNVLEELSRFRALTKAEASALASAIQYHRKPPKAVPERAAEIIQRVAAKHQLLPTELTGSSRIAPIAAARMEVYFEMRRLGWSLPRIGRIMGRDHTTVLTGIRKHQSTLSENDRPAPPGSTPTGLHQGA